LKEDFQRIKMILDNYENLGTIAGLGDLAEAGITGVAEKGPTVSAEPDLQKSKNEQLGLF
jgi:hypothetical protein